MAEEQAVAVESTPALESNPVETSPDDGGNGEPQDAGKPTASEDTSGGSGQDDHVNRLKSKYDKRQARLEKELQQSRQELQRIQQEREAEASRTEAQKLANMSEYEQAQYLLTKTAHERDQLRRALQLREQREIYEGRISKLMESTGVPRELLEETSSYDEAVELALEYNQQSVEQRIQQMVDEKVSAAIQARQRNSADTGASAPDPEPSNYDKMRSSMSATERVKAALMLQAGVISDEE